MRKVELLKYAFISLVATHECVRDYKAFKNKNDEREAKVKNSERESYLKIIFEFAQGQSKSLDDKLREMRHRVEMILISWAFIFAGITGLYQAKILNVGNVQQIVLILLVMLVSISMAVFAGVRGVPGLMTNLDDLWGKYEVSHKRNDFNSINIMETIVQDFRKTVDSDRAQVNKKSKLVDRAGYLIIAGLFAVILFIIFPDLKIIL